MLPDLLFAIRSGWTIPDDLIAPHAQTIDGWCGRWLYRHGPENDYYAEVVELKRRVDALLEARQERDATHRGAMHRWGGAA